MRRRRTLKRILGIQRVLVKYGLDEFIKETHLLRPLRFFFYVLPRRRDSTAPLGERIRLALEELGPIFVKFGQAISTRRDLLPPDIADELAKLQDMVPPFPAEQAIAILNAEYGKPVDEAMSILHYSPKLVARDLEKLLKSAVANAQQKDPELDVDRLVITQAMVNEAPTMRRARSRAMGRIFPILKRACHVQFDLDVSRSAAQG